MVRSGAGAFGRRGASTAYVIGRDVAGVLEKIGPGTDTDLAVGEHAMGTVPHGGYAEQVVVPAESVVRVPAGTDDVAASTLPMNGLTARMSVDLLGLRAGQTIAVTGAAGVYGGYVVQLAKADGLRVVAYAAPSDRELVRALGADIVVDRGDDVSEHIRRAVPEGVDGLADGAVMDDKVIGAVRDGGRIATVRGYMGASVRGVTYLPVQVRAYTTDRTKLDALRDLVEKGRLTLRVASTYPAAWSAKPTVGSRPEAHVAVSYSPSGTEERTAPNGVLRWNGRPCGAVHESWGGSIVA
jgi:NADPH:quinone reductase-like Zn-dependent oxidoreductase